ncbi:MAG: ATP-binding protein, partial [Candidatus Korobacteraceae bacterium]
VVSWIFVWRMVRIPLRRLQSATQKLMAGELGYQTDVASNDEAGSLALSFNQMSLELRQAREEVTSWARTLEERVAEKTRELRRAHEQMIRVEKMVAIGKMAAVVAHEVNNPLAGILTYAKLIKKWVTRGLRDPAQQQEASECLDLIASESRRCGELVKNLLTFSRTAPMNLEKHNVNEIIARCVRLVEHKAGLTGIQLQVDTDPAIPVIYCDAAQIEQVLLALSVNAIDAMPKGGNLWISSRSLPSDEIELQVRDDGVGIHPDLLPKLFEPFLTTKEVGKGVGLGLAVSKGIVERHGGRIELQSQLGVGTTFRVILPLDARISLEGQALTKAATGE